MMKKLFPWIALRCETERQDYELIWIIASEDQTLMYMSSNWSEWYAVPYNVREFAWAFLMISGDKSPLVYNLIENDGTLNFVYENKKEFSFRKANEEVITFPVAM